MRTREQIVNEIVIAYLESGDFNGYLCHSDSYSSQELQFIHELILDGSIEVVNENDFVNPNIRPWSTRRSREDQAAEFDGEGTSYVCLYPTAQVLTVRPEVTRMRDEPYRQAMASGRGQLELAFFEVAVLEQYRNDPRFRYWFADCEVFLGVSDDVYLDEMEPDRDKIGSVRVGLAYDVTTMRSDEVKRFVCSFFRDLADLTPAHQQRWKTFEVEQGENDHPHEMWWAMMMGHMPDSIGPFMKVQLEMEAINELFVLGYGVKLFKETEPPREWGWVLRPTSNEWHEFVLLTDKLLSENIQHSSLTAAGVDRNDANDEPMGSLQRLELFLVLSGLSKVQAVELLAPFRSIRTERQKPAHKLVTHTTEPTLMAHQRDLLIDISRSLMGLRDLLMNHPSASDWEPDEVIEERWYTV
jgi:hypothetical protein